MKKKEKNEEKTSKLFIVILHSCNDVLQITNKLKHPLHSSTKHI